jgi:asparagine synthase (glutamine-hydrolysing)
VLTAGFNHETSGLDSHDVIRMYKDQFERDFTLQRKDPLDWMCYLGYRFNIPNYYLHRLDRMGMAHSVELRAPFLDRSLTSFALSLDPSLKIRAGEPKYILKRALAKRLPDELLYRKKRGFNVPLKIWGLELLTREIESNLHRFCNDHPWFDETGLRNHLDRLKRGDGEVVNRLWTVYFLMKWFQRWMD